MAEQYSNRTSLHPSTCVIGQNHRVSKLFSITNTCEVSNHLLFPIPLSGRCLVNVSDRSVSKAPTSEVSLACSTDVTSLTDINHILIPHLFKFLNFNKFNCNCSSLKKVWRRSKKITGPLR